MYVDELQAQYEKQAGSVNPADVAGTFRLRYANNKAYLHPDQPLLASYLPTIGALLRTVAPHSPFWREGDDTAARLHVILPSITPAQACRHRPLLHMQPLNLHCQCIDMPVHRLHHVHQCGCTTSRQKSTRSCKWWCAHPSSRCCLSQGALLYDARQVCRSLGALKALPDGCDGDEMQRQFDTGNFGGVHQLLFGQVCFHGPLL